MRNLREDRHTILLVDDEATNLQVLRHTLEDTHRLLYAKDGARALELARAEHPDLILLDIMMPGMSGYDVCEQLKANGATSTIPIIFVTALSEESDEELGLSMGAVDYIGKPFNPSIVKARVRTHLSLVQANELRRTRLEIVQRLGIAAEYKDTETGQHVLRMSHYAQAMAQELGFSEAAVDDLLNAAPMHDVGKIGIPDAILQKPGPLTPEEWEVMKTHAAIGAKIIGKHESGMLEMAYTIAMYHHEKWDGTGYPMGLKGDAIPIEAQIVALADVFDALTSQRPYKPAWPVDQAFVYIEEQSGKQFNPALARAFLDLRDKILEIRERWGEDAAPGE